jgi:hypothetical protein
MNAIFREKYEAPVLTMEAIEVHLSYLRPGLEAVQAALPVLHEDTKPDRAGAALTFTGRPRPESYTPKP